MTLFENFNTSLQKSPFWEKHENFVIDLKLPGCSTVQTLPYPARCAFVQKTYECHKSVLIFDYANIFYCGLNAQNKFQQILAILVLFLFAFFFFACAAITTEHFFCPPIQMITKKLRISQNFAGCTLLSFGNGTPELVTSLHGLGGELGTLYSDLMGSAIFITAFISGCILVLKPFNAVLGTFCRDVLFQLLLISYIDYAIKSDRYVTVKESIMILCLYAAYLIIVITDQILLVKHVHNFDRELQGKTGVTENERALLVSLQKEAGLHVGTQQKWEHTQAQEETPQPTTGRNAKLFSQFFASIMPIEMEEWHEGNIPTKICIVLLSPIHLFTNLLIPAIHDHELKGWSKLLNCLQIIIMPATIALIFVPKYTIHGVEFPLCTFVVTTPIAILVFICTRTDRPPSFHVFIAALSLCGSICFVRMFANELIHVIHVLEMVTYSSSSFFGCTLLSWGKRVGDLIAGISLARQGYQMMGLASCIAGPLFCLTLGLGCSYLYRSLKEETHVFHATQGSMGENCTLFAIANLSLLLLAASTTNYTLRRCLGYQMIITYLLFCCYALLGEYNVIHTFGTDHTEDFAADKF